MHQLRQLLGQGALRRSLDDRGYLQSAPLLADTEAIERLRRASERLKRLGFAAAWLWIFDGFWHLLYFLILLAICYLWSPSKNNLQYAYMDELANLDEESLNDPDEDGGGSAEAVVTPYDLKRGA